jgi:hypothetical protein
MQGSRTVALTFSRPPYRLAGKGLRRVPARANFPGPKVSLVSNKRWGTEPGGLASFRAKPSRSISACTSVKRTLRREIGQEGPKLARSATKILRVVAQESRELLSGRHRSKPRTRSPVEDVNFTALPWAGAQSRNQRRALGSLRYEGRWYSALLIRAFTILTTRAP